MSPTKRGWMAPAALAALLAGSQLVPATALAEPETTEPTPAHGRTRCRSRSRGAAQHRLSGPCRRRVPRGDDHIRGRGRSGPDGQSDDGAGPHLRGQHRAAGLAASEHAGIHRVAVLGESALRDPRGRRGGRPGRGFHRAADHAQQGRSRLRRNDVRGAGERRGERGSRRPGREHPVDGEMANRHRPSTLSRRRPEATAASQSSRPTPTRADRRRGTTAPSRRHSPARPARRAWRRGSRRARRGWRPASR